MAERGSPWPTITSLWDGARDIDAALAERLGLTGPHETRRRALAWGLGVLGMLLVALVLSPVVAGGQSDPDQLAPAVDTSTTSTTSVPIPPSPPEALPDDYATAEDAVLAIDALTGVLANDRHGDLGPDRLEARAAEPTLDVATQTIGVVDLAEDGSFTYTPAPDFTGVDSFFYVAVDADDPSAESQPARVDISVSAVDDAPVAEPDRFSTPQGTTLRVDAPGVLANDTDADADADGVALQPTLAASPNHGELSFGPNGGFTYRPDPDFRGLDAFTYSVSDGIAASGPAQVTIEVREANVAASANDDGYSTGTDEVLTVPGPGVLTNDSDANGDALAARVDVRPPAGTVDVAADGAFTYTPPARFRGIERFTYVAVDGTTDSEPATVTIVVGPAAAAFDLGDDAYRLDQATTLAVPAPGVLANDGLEGTVRQAQEVRGPAAGVLELLADGSFLYVPDSAFSGEDSFQYAVVLGDAVSSPATVVLSVEAVDGPPASTAPTVLTPVTEAPPPPPPTVAPTPPDEPSGGTGSGAATGAGTGGGSDGGGESVAPGPTVGEGAVPGDEGGLTPGEAMTGVTVDVAGEFAGELGETPLVSLKQPAPDGQVNVNGDGTITYVPAPGFLGRDSFGYRACSIDETCVTGAVQLVVRSGPGIEGPPEVRFQILRDGALSWLTVGLAVVLLIFAVIMAVVVVRTVRGPADPFAKDVQPPLAAPFAPGT